MKLANVPVTKPQVPQVTPGAKSIDVEFVGPTLRDEVIGKMPADGYGISFVDFSSCTEPVVRAQPVIGADGKPQYSQQVAQLDLRPYSVWKRALAGSAIGAGVLGVAGSLVGHLTGQTLLGTIVGAGVGAAAGGSYAAHRYSNDSTSLDWQLTPVVRHQFDGYSHSALPQYVSNGKNSTTISGYMHSYSPQVSLHQVGDATYWQPVVIHSADQR